jgi:ribosomal protein L11 methyltransferase
VRVQHGTLEAQTETPFDLALANITIATLLELHPLLRLSLRSGGIAVLSGVLADRADELLEVLHNAGWHHLRTDQEQDWVALLVSRA